ncbi:hypothetical protein C8Q74DRAFT_577076 [Fomes fomentarius]|nr:hypothetical protein C8Q74DRAFT_577076 [Fomes fomentarius]
MSCASLLPGCSDRPDMLMHMCEAEDLDIPREQIRPRMDEDVLHCILEQLTLPEDTWYEFETIPPQQDERAHWHEYVAQRAALARCARVSRAFFELATPLLWRDVYDVRAILCSLDDTPPWSRSQPLPPPARVPACHGASSRRALYLYCIRAVHQASLSPPSRGLPPPMRVTTEDEPLKVLLIPPLPRLTQLRWVQEVPGDTGELLALLSTSLRCLHLIFRHPHPSARSDRDRAFGGASSDYESFVQMLLTEVSDRAPDLTYFRCTPTTCIRESWLYPIQRLSKLETVDLLEPHDVASDSALLKPLSTLPRLRTLKIPLRTTPFPLFSNSEASTHTASFPALRNLRLSGTYTPLSAAIDVLNAITSPHLKTLHMEGLECRSCFVGAELGRLRAVLAAKPFCATLTRFALSVHGLGLRPPFTLAVDWQGDSLGVRPLLEMLSEVSFASSDPSPNAAEGFRRTLVPNNETGMVVELGACS